MRSVTAMDVLDYLTFNTEATALPDENTAMLGTRVKLTLLLLPSYRSQSFLAQRHPSLAMLNLTL